LDCTAGDWAACTSFLRGLAACGLSSVRLVISDEHLGLKQALAAVLPGAGHSLGTLPCYLTLTVRRRSMSRPSRYETIVWIGMLSLPVGIAICWRSRNLNRADREI